MVGLDGPPLPFATRCLSSAFPFASSCWYRRDRSRAVRLSLDAAKLETEFRSEVSAFCATCNAPCSSSSVVRRSQFPPGASTVCYPVSSSFARHRRGAPLACKSCREVEEIDTTGF